MCQTLKDEKNEVSTVVTMDRRKRLGHSLLGEKQVDHLAWRHGFLLKKGSEIHLLPGTKFTAQ